MRYTQLLLAAPLVLLGCSDAGAQSISRQGPDGTQRITPTPQILRPQIQDPNLVHLGIYDERRDAWRALAPVRNLPPSALRVVGSDKGLHVALFNYKQKERRESSLAFQLRPFADKQVVEVSIFAVEQDGRPVAPTPLSNPQSIALKRQGAVLPFTMAMNKGETLTCEIHFMVNGRELGTTRIRMDHAGIAFAPEVKTGGKKPQ